MGLLKLDAPCLDGPSVRSGQFKEVRRLLDMADQTLIETNEGWLGGQLLVAMPTMQDARFAQTVILVCDHDEDHAMGLVINRPVPELTLPKLLEKIGIDDAIRAPALPVLDGGPCQRDRGFVLHTNDWHSEDSTLQIGDDLCLTATRDVLEAIAGGSSPQRAAMALGYAGWGAGQLDAEIQENAWLVIHADPDKILDLSNMESKWVDAFSTLGIDPARLSGDAGRA